MAEIKKRIEGKHDTSKHKIECLAVFNTLIPAIRELVEDRDVDLIVMGTKGATGAKEILFGSNTVHVFKGVKCPVLAIPSGFDYEKPLEILFPTDYDVAFNQDQVKSLIDLAELHHSRINVMHVFYGESLSDAQAADSKANNSVDTTHLDTRIQELKQQLELRFEKLESQAASEAPSPENLKSLNAELKKQSREIEQLKVELFKKQTTIDQLQGQIHQLSKQVANGDRLPEQNSVALDTVQKETGEPELNSYEFRNWTGNNGKVIEMAFVEFDGDQVEFIDRERKRIRCRLEQLSADDQEFLRRLKK